jgi:hypothetical protein
MLAKPKLLADSREGVHNWNMSDGADVTMGLLGVWCASRMGLRLSNFSRREGIT